MSKISLERAQVTGCDGLKLKQGQLVALVVRGFLSFPARVKWIDGDHAGLKFENRLHDSVMDLIADEVLAESIANAELVGPGDARLPSFYPDLEVCYEDEMAFPELEDAFGETVEEAAQVC